MAEEKQRVLSSSVLELAKRDVLVLRRMSRVYGSFCAVHELSFGVRKGECFGLLGINGAGKTTTFNMLTATIGPSAGEAFVDGYSVTNDTKQVSSTHLHCNTKRTETKPNSTGQHRLSNCKSLWACVALCVSITRTKFSSAALRTGSPADRLLPADGRAAGLPDRPRGADAVRAHPGHTREPPRGRVPCARAALLLHAPLG